MGASFTKDNHGISSSDSSLTSVPAINPPSDVYQRGSDVPLSKLGSSGAKGCLEIQKPFFADWKRLLQWHELHQVHPQRRQVGQSVRKARRYIKQHSLPSRIDSPTSRPRNKPKYSSASLPMKCPTRAANGAEPIPMSYAHSVTGSYEYRKKLYDLRTWNMYNLIMESRRIRQRPVSLEAEVPVSYDTSRQHDRQETLYEDESQTDSGHLMVFDLDDH